MDFNRQNVQNTGIFTEEICAKKLLTKMLALWYNGISARVGRARAANFNTFSKICQ